MPPKRAHETHAVSLDNSGLLVFLYDAANAATLTDAGPRVLSGFSGPGDANDPALKTLPPGALVVYELPQDDTVNVDVIVGPLLTRTKQGNRHDPVRTRLSLPSGALRIESYESLSVGPNPGEQEGQTIAVTPGDYVLSLYRRGESAGGARRKAPANDVVVLTPLVAAPALASTPSLLLLTNEPAAVDHGIVTGGAWRGRVLETFVGGGAIALTMTREHTRELGITRGQKLDIELPAGTRTAVYLGPLIPQDRWPGVILGDALTALREATPPALGAWLQLVRLDAGAPQEEHVIIGPLDPKRSAEAWDGADAKSGETSVRPQASHAFVADDDAPLLEHTTRERTLHARIIASRSDRVALGASSAAITALGAKAGDELALRIGDKTHRVIWGLSAPPDIIQRRRQFESPFEVKMSDDPALSFAEKFAKRKEDEAAALVRMTAEMPLLGVHGPHWDDASREVLYCQPLVRDNAGLELGLAVPRGTAVTLTLE